MARSASTKNDAVTTPSDGSRDVLGVVGTVVVMPAFLITVVVDVVALSITSW